MENSLGNRLNQLRTKHKISLRNLAKATGMHHQTIWSLETGLTPNPSLANIQKLADYFGVTVTYLIEGDFDDHNPNTLQLKRIWEQLNLLDKRRLLDIAKVLKKHSEE